MYMTRSPVDELARLRAKIAELRAREAALEARFIEGNDTGRFPGYSWDVVVSRTSYQVFDISKLPQHILNDDRYYATKHVTSIRIEDRDESDAVIMLDAPEEFQVLEQL
ncbi:MAG: hypothetical protein HWE33_07470 [Rhodobacteraceae bacterium]|uniref:hypothetical protein n=1 Tax=Celeribacter sp. HF31 TaxID=2721558 RepID=UPI001431D710|nr:hypothetical protein [Celeribacter sp. HF31]NIY80352.1 hypothetical protein [Celeribacter sp. HF31]NVK46126.1 hypothetical protein [Paracoccaceae bacterium]